MNLLFMSKKFLSYKVLWGTSEGMKHEYAKVTLINVSVC